jgi:uncharacterized protein YndB with AHSA1/START domain
MKARSDQRDSRATLSFEVQLDAPPALVWRVLTIPEYVARWLDAPIAGPTAARPEDDARRSPSPAAFHLLDSEPQRCVRYAWRDEADPAVESIVTFRLRPNEAGGATLNIVHEMTARTGSLAPKGAANRSAPPLLLAA